MVEDKTSEFDIDCPIVSKPSTISQCNITFYTGSYSSMAYQMTDDSDQSESINVLRK